MSKSRRKPKGVDLMKLAKTAAWAFGALGMVAGAVWAGSEFIQFRLESRVDAETAHTSLNEGIQLAGGQVQYVLDQQVEALYVKIDRAKRKKNKDKDDYEYIKYLEEQLKTTKRIKKGSK